MKNFYLDIRLPAVLLPKPNGIYHPIPSDTTTNWCPRSNPFWMILIHSVNDWHDRISFLLDPCLLHWKYLQIKRQTFLSKWICTRRWNWSEKTIYWFGLNGFYFCVQNKMLLVCDKNTLHALYFKVDIKTIRINFDIYGTFAERYVCAVMRMYVCVREFMCICERICSARHLSQTFIKLKR